MKAAVLICLSTLVAVCSFLPCAAAAKPKPKATPPPPTHHRRTHYDRFLDSVFEQADTNNDGRMTLTETYEWVLRLYVKMNRQAPVNPPTYAQVKRIHALMDDDNSNSIGQDELRELAEFFVGRATVRVVVSKIIKLVVAPLAAEALLRWFQKQDQLYEAVVVPYVPERLIPIVTNPVIGRTVLMILIMTTLGGMLMELVNDILDSRLEQKEAAEMAAAEVKVKKLKNKKNKEKKKR